jgi:hypothetical protein
MEHEVIVRNIQFAWEFLRAMAPALVLAGATYWVATWGEAR